MTEKELRRPMTALLIAPEYPMRNAIHRGEKTITIREGWRDYRIGDTVLIGCDLAPWAVMGKISSVAHSTIRELTDPDFRDDGFESREDAVEKLGRFYKGINMDSKVTVIRWATNPRGYYVRNPDKFDEWEVSRFSESDNRA